MKQAKNWKKILEDTRKIDNILIEQKYSVKNKKRITVILTQVAFEVYVHEIQKQNGTWKERMRYEDRLNSLKGFVKSHILKDLKSLYQIRNQYAHKLKPDTSLIKSLENGLELWTSKTKKTKDKYVFASTLCLKELEFGLQRALGVMS